MISSLNLDEAVVGDFQGSYDAGDNVLHLVLRMEHCETVNIQGVSGQSAEISSPFQPFQHFSGFRGFPGKA
jgi:hypothetical protein